MRFISLSLGDALIFLQLGSGLTRNYSEHKVRPWSGPERLMFTDCSLVFRKSFETFDDGKFAHTFRKPSARN